MEQTEIFQVLGIDATDDEREIKGAYRDKLSITNPEDNPEGFKRLRTAYEEACRLAKQNREDKPAEEKDTSPSGLWVQKADSIYKNIRTRQDVQEWKALFEEDVFLSLEDEENCRVKLLRFLMEHFRLPSGVWKLLDGKLSIVRDEAKLREKFPADFIHYIVNKCERGEDVEFEQFDGAEDANYDLFLQYYDKCWQSLQENNLEQAAEYIANADDLHIFHPVMEICRAGLLVKQEKADEAINGLKELYRRFPEDTMIAYNIAETLWQNGQKKDAAEVFEALKKENEEHYMANMRLTDWYYEQGMYKEAKKCAEKVLSAGADDKFMELLEKVNSEIEKGLEKEYAESGSWEAGLELCWCYLQDGRISKGITLAVDIEKKLPPEKEAEHDGLMAKLYIEEAEYGDAAYMAEVWEKALEKKIETDETEEEREKDLDRIRQSHLIRMQCNRGLGYANKENFTKAIAEAEKVEIGTSKDIGVLLEKAQIYMEMEEYEKSLELVQRLVEDYQIYAAYATSLEVYRRQWNAGGVIQAGRQCINYFPNYIRAYEHVAKVFLDLKRKEDFDNLLAEAGKNNIKSVLLDAYKSQMDSEAGSMEAKELDEKLQEFRKKYSSAVEGGDEKKFREGLPILTGYLYAFPGTYMLVERGIFYRAAHRYTEAKEDFEKALAENPAQPYALNGLSFVYKYMGNYEKALICIKKAILYMDKEDMSPLIYTDMANLYMLMGNYKMALAAFKQYENLAGRKNKYVMGEMAKALARADRPAESYALLKAVYKDDSDKFSLYDKLVDMYQTTGQEQKAEELLRKWAEEPEVKKLLKSSLIEKLFIKNSREPAKQEVLDYYNRKAWQELLYGRYEQAIDWFGKLVDAKRENSAAGEGFSCDAVFACLLYGDDKHGKKYSEKLRNYLLQEKNSGKNPYFNREKGHLQLVFLASCYTEKEETLKAILEKEKESEICHFCTYAVCKELEAVRIAWLLRIGRREEAMERLENTLKIQPQDEYMMAIRHRIEKEK